MSQLPIRTNCTCRLCPTHAGARFIPPLPSEFRTSDGAEILQGLITNLRKEAEEYAEPTKRFYKALAEVLELIGVKPGMAIGGRVVAILMEEMYGAETEKQAEEVVLGLGYLEELMVVLSWKVEERGKSEMNTAVSESTLTEASTTTPAPPSETVSTSTLASATILTATSISPPIPPDDQARGELASHLKEEVAALRKDARGRAGEPTGTLLNALAEALEAVGARAGYEDAGMFVELLADEMGLGELESMGVLSLLVYMKELLGALYEKVESMTQDAAALEEN